jgi:hypothetical protein
MSVTKVLDIKATQKSVPWVVNDWALSPKGLSHDSMKGSIMINVKPLE